LEIIFDFDGTLAEGGSYSFGWLFELARRHGYRQGATKARAALSSCTDFEVVERLEIRDRPEELTRSLLEKSWRSLDDVWWDPALRRVLEELAETHVLHVLSNRDQESLEDGLVRIGCRNLFNCCVGSSSGLEGKPSTTLYQRLRNATTVPVERGVYIGDKESDHEFAQRAGLGFLAACWYRATLLDHSASCVSVDRLPHMLRQDRHFWQDRLTGPPP